jgi:hypothetical protein
MQLTFNTKVGATPAMQYGKVLYNDFFSEDSSSFPTTGLTFPSECANVPMTPQEKLLEFSIFDLTNFITPPR